MKASLLCVSMLEHVYPMVNRNTPRLLWEKLHVEKSYVSPYIVSLQFCSLNLKRALIDIYYAS